MVRPSSIENIHYIDISFEGNLDILRWQSVGKSLPLDIIAARQKAIENVILHHEINEKKSAFFRIKQFIFIIGSNEFVQYQILDAILYDISKDFLDRFGNIPQGKYTPVMIKEFTSQIPSLITKTEKESIKWVSGICKVCNKEMQIAVKKKLIVEAESFPVALVFYHKGHGILVYLDRDFKVRGVEQVDISG